jgi:hypothetical protein
MALPDVAPLITKDFVTLKIDYDRSKGAREIEKKYVATEQGLPWFAFLDPTGRAIITSTGPKGNVGMPWEPHEVGHFKTLLETAKKHLTDEEIASVIASIQAFRRQTESGATTPR